MIEESKILYTVSVVIPAYNAAVYLKDTIQSVLNQTFKDYEIILVDDGSRDNTKKVVASFGSKVKYIFHHNMGPGYARNVGIFHAEGKYIAFLDADDVWLPDKLSQQVAFMEANPEVCLTFTDFLFERNVGRCAINAFDLSPQIFSIESEMVKQDFYIFKNKIFDSLMVKNFLGTSTVVVNNKCFDAVGRFNISLSSAQDRDLWLRIAKKYKFGFINKPLAHYTFNPNSISRNKVLRYSNLSKVLERHIGDTKPEIRRMVNANLAQLKYDLGHDYFTEGKFGAARWEFLESLFKRWSSRSFVYLIASMLPAQFIRFIKATKGRGLSWVHV